MLRGDTVSFSTARVNRVHRSISRDGGTAPGITRDGCKNSSERTQRIKAFWNICKWLLVVAAVIWLVREGMLSSGKFSFAPAAPLWLAGGAVLYVSCVFGFAWRFHLMVRSLAYPSTFGGQVRLFLAGLLPQMIGSALAFDIMRAMALRRAGVPGGAIGGILLTDRMLGVLALLFSLVAILLLFLDMGDVWLSLWLAIFFIAAIPLCFFAWNGAANSSRFAFLNSVPGSKLVCGMAEAMRLLCRRPAYLVALFMMSVILQVAMLTVLYCVGNALLNAKLPLIDAIAGGVVATLTTIVPLPAAGAGVGEGVFGAVAAATSGRGDAADFAPVYLMNRLLLLGIGVAAWLWLAVRTKAGNGE